MALKWLNSIESSTGRIARWALELQQYDFEVAYRKGQLNVVADAMSRQPLAERCLRTTEEEAEKGHEPEAECGWIKKVKERMRTEPRKYPDYVEEAGREYPHILIASSPPCIRNK
ncbi:GL19007 [Drosophila persimilis]|uniref:GL19007 n=1 Tax=Drosophila persimilis TaxID=7234 RepID=B4HCG3_DROPE|nr:GL19007 [Drosophila persimilis]